MKLLRETIKNLILENQRHFELIASGMMRAGLSDSVNMKTAINDMFNSISLAETLEYIVGVSHVKQPPTFEGTLYRWEFTATQPLFDELKRIEQEIEKNVGSGMGNVNFARRLYPRSRRVIIRMLNPEET